LLELGVRKGDRVAVIMGNCRSNSRGKCCDVQQF
jgi:hypothetical protein